MKNKQVLQISVSHEDPEIEKQGSEAVKQLVEAIGQIMGENVTIHNTLEELKDSQPKEDTK